MRVNVDIKKITETRESMLNKIKEIQENINEINRKIEDSKKVFDTPAATTFRDSANKYMEDSRIYINSVLIPIVENLSNVVKAYEDAISTMNDSVDA